MIKFKSIKVCVFCGSKSGNHENFLKVAFKVGKELSKKKYSVIYGGGKHGLMGALAEGVTTNNWAHWNLNFYISYVFKNCSFDCW